MDLKRMLGLAGVAAVLGVGGTWVATQIQWPSASVMQGEQVAPGGPPSAYAQGQKAGLDVPYVPTPEPVVEKMLEMAKVKPGDVVYDLGCGDGRIVVTAAKKYGARGVGVDIDPDRIKDSHATAKAAGVTDKVKFVQRDLFKMDLKAATVVTLYLLPEINLKLRPKLFEQLKPGTRIVSHDFDMGQWVPEQTVKMTVDREHKLYYWTIPTKENRPKFTNAAS